MNGIGYEQFSIGMTLEGSVTVTESHIFAAAGLFNDFNSMHVDDEFAKASLFGQRIAHGPMTAGIMMGVLGNALSGTGIGDLGMSCRFPAPLFVGSTLATVWEVADLSDREKHDGGVVSFEGHGHREDGVEVARIETQVLVKRSRA